MGKMCAYSPPPHPCVRVPARRRVRKGRCPHWPACAVTGLFVFSASAGERPPGASSFRSCGKKRKKGTPKGRAFYKAALPFGIPSSEDCFPAAPYAAVRAASLRSARAIAVRRGMSEGPAWRIGLWICGNNPTCHSERSEESRCKFALDSSSLRSSE